MSDNEKKSGEIFKNIFVILAFLLSIAAFVVICAVTGFIESDDPYKVPLSNEIRLYALENGKSLTDEQMNILVNGSYDDVNDLKEQLETLWNADLEPKS